MNKYLIPVFFVSIVLSSCGNASTESNETLSGESQEENYFPVTSYLKGQVLDIKTKFLTPVLYRTIAGKTDSTWIKSEQLDSVFNEFYSPVIDTANMKPFFKESKFLDGTLNSFTYTYEPIGKLPDSITLKHWEIYVNPETGRVKRVFIARNDNSRKKFFHLSWLEEDGLAKINEFVISGDSIKPVSEQLIKWKF